MKSAKILLETEEYKSANNQAYYAVFHVFHTIHALDGKAYKRHSNAISNFSKEYVKREIFPREMGRKLGEAEEIRHARDYDDFYLASREESERLAAITEEFIQMVEEYSMVRLRESNSEIGE